MLQYVGLKFNTKYNIILEIIQYTLKWLGLVLTSLPSDQGVLGSIPGYIVEFSLMYNIHMCALGVSVTSYQLVFGWRPLHSGDVCCKGKY